MGKLMAYPQQKEPEDVWQRSATAAAILAVRDLIKQQAIPPATPIGRLDDIELGWLIAASLFGWIKCRSEQAIAEGWSIEATLHATGLDPDPWDAGVVESILPELGELQAIDWHRPISAWPKAMMVRFLLEATEADQRDDDRARRRRRHRHYQAPVERRAAAYRCSRGRRIADDAGRTRRSDLNG